MINEGLDSLKYTVNSAKNPKKILKQDKDIYRNIVLWGWNSKNEPSFLILYGKHNYKESNSNGDEINNILDDFVNYTGYVIFNGSEGHLPSFKSLTFVEEPDYYNRDKADEFPRLYYKKHYTGYYYSLKDEDIFEGYKKLQESQFIKIPYYEHIDYCELIKIIKNNSNTNGSSVNNKKKSIFNIFMHSKKDSIECNNVFEDFTLADSPNDILKLSSEFNIYYEPICELMSNKNLFSRKKALKTILDSNPPNQIYELLFSLGSTELISGLFLELAKRKNNQFVHIANNIINSNINWDSQNYVLGLKRCANIYINACSEELRQKREQEIRSNISDIDLHLTNINGKSTEGKIFGGKQYRKFYYDGLFNKYYYTYERDENGRYHSIKRERENHFKESDYCDGFDININKLKNVIQEAECYEMADVIGKIAYYIDAPRLTYYFKGSGNSPAHRYFKRYLRRIIESYAENNKEKYIEAIKNLFTSYTKDDYVCKFVGNFQFNYFIKYFLYYDFKEKPPVGWDNWHERYAFMSKDQLLKLEGRYEYRKDIFDEYLEDVLYIASKATVNDVLKACYYILKDSSKVDTLINNISIEQLIKLCEVSYEPLSNWFRQVLDNKISLSREFDSKLMLELINSDNNFINELAQKYFKNTNGKFSPKDTLNLLLLDSPERYADLFKENIQNMDSSEYILFVNEISNSNLQFESKELTKVIEDILYLSTDKISDLSMDQKNEIVSSIYANILSNNKASKIVQNFFDEVVFSIDYEELKIIVNNMDFKANEVYISERYNQIISLMKSIKEGTIPDDFEIQGILSDGTSKMVGALLAVINENEHNLNDRFSTILIMLESDVVSLNTKAQDVFNKLDSEKQKQCHKIILDSPIKTVYEFAISKLKEFYGDNIPKDFIIQMLEHSSTEVKSFISDKCKNILNDFNNEELFMYYSKTLLLCPNKLSKDKNKLYDSLIKFAKLHEDKSKEIEELLLEVGSSNIIKNSEEALVTLAQIRKGA